MKCSLKPVRMSCSVLRIDNFSVQNAIDKTPMALELYYIPVGPAPLASATIINDQLWCAMGSKAVILNTK